MDYPIHGMYDAIVIYGKSVKHSKNNERTATSLCYNDKQCGKKQERREQNATSDRTYCFTGHPLYRRTSA